MAKKINQANITKVENGYVFNVSYFDQEQEDKNSQQEGPFVNAYTTETHLALKGGQLVKLVKAFIAEAEGV